MNYRDFLQKVIYAIINPLIKAMIAVGITPSMLPMIVNVNLTKGSKNLAKKKVLVKRIEAIQNFDDALSQASFEYGLEREDFKILEY